MATTKLKLSTIVASPNVAKLLTSDELVTLGQEAVTGYFMDLATRSDWEERNALSMKLALQVVEQKNFPWVGASNVKFPLVTIAALQFLARVGLLTKGDELVKVKPWGPDPEGKKGKKADRLSLHMSYQISEEDFNWREEDERGKLAASILGSFVKKTYFDGVEGLTKSSYIPLMDFVVDYYCKDLDKAQRATHRMDMFKNQIEENIRRGLFLEMDDLDSKASAVGNVSPLKAAGEQSQGVARPSEDPNPPFEILEQHCWLDLDGDGYREPYVMFIRLDTKQVLRIVARFFDEGDVFRVNDAKIRQLEAESKKADGYEAQSTFDKEAQKLEESPENKILRIVPITQFTMYTFIPSPDGGIYGLGLGALLGPTNAAVDTLINQLLDAGRMLTTSGGFLGRGVKIKSGKQSFDPFEWKNVDGTGDDLRKNIVPLPVNAPSEVLLNLLGILISYGEKIGSATDIMTGVSPGQNTPAETSRNTLEQGMMLFSGIYSRMYRGFANELRKIYNHNKWYLKQSPRWPELTGGEGALLMEDDYDVNTMRIYPAADPNAVSSAQKQAKAKLVYEVQSQNPNGFNRYEVIKSLLEAHDVDSIDKVFPDPQGPNAIAPIPNPKVELEKAKLQQKQQEHQDNMMLETASLKNDIALAEAKIIELQAKAEKELAEAKGVDTGHQIAIIEAQIGAAKANKENLMRVLENWQASRESQRKHELEVQKLGTADGKTKSADKPAAVG